jgi:hypothetical protein
MSNYTPEQLARYTPAQLARAISVTKHGKTDYLFIPTDIQAEIMAAREPNVFIVGNRGGGKSICLRWLCHALALAVPGFRYAILRTSFPELMKNHLIYLDEEMGHFGAREKSYYHKTDHVCYYPNGSIGFYAQCETDADVKKVLGAEVMMVVFDEAPTFQWDHMRLIAASVRVVKGSGLTPMIRYAGNPVGESIDELWRYFIDKDVSPDNDPEYNPADWRAIEIRLEDNPYLDQALYRKQFAGLPEHIRQAWLNGVRVEERTLFRLLPEKHGRPYHVIYDSPALSDGTPVLKQDQDGRYTVPSWVRIYRAYDHGYWPDPAVCLWFAVIGRRIVCFKEKAYYRTVVKDIAEDVKSESAGLTVSTTYADPTIDVKTGADVYTIRQKFEAEGVAIDLSINNREFFADAIHSALQEEIEPGVPRIQFVASGCPDLIKYLPRMKWDERHPRAMAEHRYDHWPVALAYFLMSQIPETKPQEIVKPRPWMLPKRPKTRYTHPRLVRWR